MNNSKFGPLIVAIGIIGESYSKQIRTVADRELQIFQTQSPSISRMPIQQKFSNLAATWKTETQFLSSTRDIVMNHAYLQIIGMGPDVTPLLLSELKYQPDHWFVALKSITGADPVKQVDRGDLTAMTASWLQWGKENGYQS